MSLAVKPGALPTQALWFVLVGAAAAAVHFVALLGLVQGVGLAPAPANAVAFAVAFCVSFGGHFRLSFRHLRARRSWLASMWRWLLSSLAAFGFNQALFVLCLNYWGEGVYVWLWLAVTAVVTLLSFALGRLWAFRAEEKSA